MQNYSKDGGNPGLATVQYQYSALPLPTKNNVHNLPGQPHAAQPLHLRHKVRGGYSILVLMKMSYFKKSIGLNEKNFQI